MSMDRTSTEFAGTHEFPPPVRMPDRVGFGGPGDPGGGYGGQPGGFGQPGGGYGGPPGGDQPGWGAPPPTPPGGPTDSTLNTLKIAALCALIGGIVLSLIGLVPCLGLVNWLALPVNLAAIALGAIGLVKGKQPDGSANPYQTIFIVAAAVGGLFFVVSFVRCLLGGGVL